jgi:protein-tyrosine phosphatase
LDYSTITNELIIGTTPASTDYDLLRSLGVGLVINMRVERRPFPDPHNPPLNFLWLPTFDWPMFPIPMAALKRGAQHALETIRSGKSVFTHCAGGRHRGVAMGAAVLIARGMDPEEAMRLIASQRRAADPQVFYIRSRILRFAQTWNKSA